MIDSKDLPVDENSVLVLKGCGPRGYPGMPETGNMPLPQKLLAKYALALLLRDFVPAALMSPCSAWAA